MNRLPTLGPFRLQRPLGKGGMAMVWRAVHQRHNEPVAIKIMTGTQAGHQRFVDSFHREVRAVARMHHPHIVRIFDYGAISDEVAVLSDGHVISGSPYMVMELADTTLTRIDRGGLGWGGVYTILYQILDALAHAHARGLIHRDLKPDNILFLADAAENDKQLKLADFGVAFAFDAATQLERENEVIIGTPQYMAPEQIRGDVRDQGPWTDLYALGCVAYWLTTGATPFSTGTTEEVLRCHLSADRPDLQPDLRVPRGFDRWVSRLLTRHPRRRFQRAADAAAALHRLTTTGPTRRLALTSESAQGERSGFILTNPEEDTHVLEVGAQGERAVATEPSPQGDRWPHIPSCWRRVHQPAKPIEMVGVGLELFELREIPLVGRHRHRDVMWQQLVDTSVTQDPHLLVIDGPTGIGKTRLATWLAHRAHEVGAAEVLSASHSPIAGPADGLARMFANHLGCVGLSRAQILQRIRDRYDDTGGLDEDALHQCIALTELVASSADPGFDAQGQMITFGRPQERFVVWKRYLSRLGRRRPVVLLLDDAHWSCDTLAFAKYLVCESHREELPVLLVLTVRDGRGGDRHRTAGLVADMVEQPRTRHLSLGPLAHREHCKLIASLLHLQPALADRVAQRTSGNPLFAIQLVGDWVERGLLRVGGQGFVLVDGADPELPSDIESLMVERLEGLIGRSLDGAAGTALEPLELAATLGQDVDYIEWRHLCPAQDIETGRRILAQLAMQSLVRITADGWTFSSGALRETLLGLAAEQGRLQDHHQRCARMLRQRYTEISDERSPRLALHLLEAGAIEEAIQPLLGSIRYYVKTCDFVNAQTFLEWYGDALRRLGIGDTDPRSVRGRLWAARLANRERRFERQLALVQACRRDVDPEQHRGLYAEILTEYAFAKGAVYEFDDALQSVVEAQEFYEMDGDEWHVARCIRHRGWLLSHQNKLDDALRFIEEALRRLELLEDPADVAQCRHSLGIVLRKRNELSRAITVLRQAERSFRELGDLLRVSHCVNSLGEAYRQQGALRQAVESYREGIKLRRRVGFDHHFVFLFNLGVTQLEQRAFDNALRSFRDALASETATANRDSCLGIIHAGLAACMAGRASWDSHDDHLDKARDHLQTTEYIEADLARIFLVAAGEAEDCGELHRAQRAYRLAAEQWRQLGNEERLNESETALQALACQS